jgi:hypothetical protein
MKLRFGFATILACLLAFTFGVGVAHAAKKILYFTAGPVPTTTEKAAIAKLNAQAAAPYVVRVRNSIEARNHAREATDYVAGAAIPPNYRDGGVDSGSSIYTVYNPSSPIKPDAFN